MVNYKLGYKDKGEIIPINLSKINQDENYYQLEKIDQFTLGYSDSDELKHFLHMQGLIGKKGLTSNLGIYYRAKGKENGIRYGLFLQGDDEYLYPDMLLAHVLDITDNYEEINNLSSSNYATNYLRKFINNYYKYFDHVKICSISNLINTLEVRGFLNSDEKIILLETLNRLIQNIIWINNKPNYRNIHDMGKILRQLDTILPEDYMLAKNQSLVRERKKESVEQLRFY